MNKYLKTEETLSFDFFKLSSRLGRVRHLGLFSLWLSVWMVGTFFLKAFPHHGLVWKMMLNLIFIVGMVNLVFLHVRRLNDFGYRGWWLLLTAIPILGQLWGISIFLIPGSNSTNRFGNAPSEPSIVDYLSIGAAPFVYFVFFLFGYNSLFHSF